MQEPTELEGKVLLITHKGCKDGLGVAMAMTQYANEHPEIELEIHWAHYNDGVNPNVIGIHVIMADFSYDRKTIIQMHKDAKSLVVLDHHTSAEFDLEGLDYCLFDMDKSGAMLMWEYLYPTEVPPAIIQYIQDRDLWTWELKYSREINAAFTLGSDKEVLSNLDYYMSERCIKPLFVNGEPIVKYQDAIIAKITKKPEKMTMVKVAGYEVPCLNNSHLISEIGNEITKYFPFSLQYFMTGDKIVFSMRSDKKSVHGFVDVEQIAISFGGGGHPEAAGFSFGLDVFNFNNFFVNKVLDKQ